MDPTEGARALLAKRAAMHERPVDPEAESLLAALVAEVDRLRAVDDLVKAHRADAKLGRAVREAVERANAERRPCDDEVLDIIAAALRAEGGTDA